MGKRLGVRRRELWLALLVLAALIGLAGPSLDTSGTVVLGPPDEVQSLSSPAVHSAPALPRENADPVWVYLPASTGEVKFEFTPATGNGTGVLWLSGTDGGVDGPFDGFYSRLARTLQRQGIASAQLEYSRPGDFETSLYETLVAIDYLRSAGLSYIAVVGFSFGGGVAVAAAAERPEVRTTVVLSGQGYGTDRVAEIAPRPILIVHTEGDTNIPIEVARSLLERAGAPAELVELPSNDHYLEDVARNTRGLVRRWLAEWLAADGVG